MKSSNFLGKEGVNFQSGIYLCESSYGFIEIKEGVYIQRIFLEYIWDTLKHNIKPAILRDEKDDKVTRFYHLSSDGKHIMEKIIIAEYNLVNEFFHDIINKMIGKENNPD